MRGPRGADPRSERGPIEGDFRGEARSEEHISDRLPAFKPDSTANQYVTVLAQGEGCRLRLPPLVSLCVVLPMVLLISTVSQIGDFIVSFFKRKSKVKNTGNILPGHGGLLDRTDGMIFAIPFAYIYLYLLSN